MKMKKMVKIAGVTVLALNLVLAGGLPVLADSVRAAATVSGDTATSKIKVKYVKYDLEEEEDDDQDENVKIKFSTRVSWKKSAKVKVTDEKGTSLNASIEDKDSDDCELSVDKLEEGHTYTVNLSGIGVRKSGKYGTFKITFEIPAPNTEADSGKPANIRIKKAEYDIEDGELELKFASKVTFSKKAEVTITDKKGKKIDAEITDYDSDECTIEADLVPGETYYFTIDGICKKGQKTYCQLSGSFVAEED